MRIISGGQTGVDRAALDVALKHGIECGGWCPEGRMDEFGRIPEKYPVQELPNAGFAERTRQNVIESDATVIFSSGMIEGGTDYTLQCCRDQKRPYLIIDVTKFSKADAAKAIVSLIQAQNIQRLNIAGPRESEWHGGYDYVFAVLEKVLQRCLQL